ncbi:MAG: hypothetical protein ACPIOQ_62585, partial [Promethearchaeia archaeon]
HHWRTWQGMLRHRHSWSSNCGSTYSRAAAMSRWSIAARGGGLRLKLKMEQRTLVEVPAAERSGEEALAGGPPRSRAF